MPIPFDIEGGMPLAVARALSVAALLSLFGTLCFDVFVRPRAFGRMLAPDAARVGVAMLRTARFSVLAGVIALLVWIVAQAGNMAGAANPSVALRAVPAVISFTSFGHVAVMQLAAILAVPLALGRDQNVLRTRLAFCLAGTAVMLQAGHGHAQSMYDGPSLLLAADVVHLLGAGAWLGGLLPLLLFVHLAPARDGAAAARWFSPMGKLCVAALAISAAYQGWALVESVPGLVGTAYGWTIMVKLVLFAVLLAFAWANRYRLAPALLRENAGIAKAALVRSVAVQTMFGMAIVGAAAVLSSLPPSMHVQPHWPFADRFTLDTIGEDPDFRNEVLWATGALGVALALVVLAAVLRRRVRWAAAAGAVAIAWVAIPHLDLLFVPAYPTSYYNSPTNFAVTSIARGAELFPANCAACHGPTGRGDGPAAKTLPVPPADLTASHLWMHSDGELFWWLSHGMEGPEGQLAMPGFASVLTEDERWNLIDYIRAHNAGLVFAGIGSWSPAVMAPELQATCEGGRSVTLQDLRGTFVRLVLGPAPAVPVPGLLTVTTAGGVPVPGTCVADDTLISRAYAVVSGAAPGDMVGEQFLIDGAGVLRAAWKPGAAPDWTDPQVLSGIIRELAAHSVSPAAPGGTMNMPM